jgi:hypothetical protein
MSDNNPLSGGRRNRWPLSLDEKDPEGVAYFCLTMGYDFANVVNTVRRHCNLGPIEARRITAQVARNEGIPVPTPSQEESH